MGCLSGWPRQARASIPSARIMATGGSRGSGILKAIAWNCGSQHKAPGAALFLGLLRLLSLLLRHLLPGWLSLVCLGRLRLLGLLLGLVRLRGLLRLLGLRSLLPYLRMLQAIRAR